MLNHEFVSCMKEAEVMSNMTYVGKGNISKQKSEKKNEI